MRWKYFLYLTQTGAAYGVYMILVVVLEILNNQYWEPAFTEWELYGQLEQRQYRKIDRSDVTDRKTIGSG